MKVIGIVNQKGGVAKTTTAKETAALLASSGHRTVAIDLDGQHDLTSFFIDEERPGLTVTDVLSGDATATDAVIQSGRDGLDVLPADDRAYSLAQEGVSAGSVMALVEDLTGGYEYAVIDFPRVVSPATIAALSACDAVVIPTEASRASAEAASATLDTLERIDGIATPTLLVTRHNARTNIGRQYVELIEGMAEEHGARVSNARISLATAVPEAEGYGLTLQEHKPWSRPAQDYRDYLMELLSALAAS